MLRVFAEKQQGLIHLLKCLMVLAGLNRLVSRTKVPSLEGYGRGSLQPSLRG